MIAACASLASQIPYFNQGTTIHTSECNHAEKNPEKSTNAPPPVPLVPMSQSFVLRTRYYLAGVVLLTPILCCLESVTAFSTPVSSVRSRSGKGHHYETRNRGPSGTVVLSFSRDSKFPDTKSSCFRHRADYAKKFEGLSTKLQVVKICILSVLLDTVTPNKSTV